MRESITLILIALSINALILIAPVWAQEAESQASLDAIREEIKRKQEQVSEQLKSAEVVEKTLADAEIKIGEVARSLNQTQIVLENVRQQLKTLERERDALESQVEQQKAALAKLIKSAYLTGQNDYAKMMFNQTDAGKFERVIAYYQYLNSARQDQIDEFRASVARLADVNLALESKQQDLLASQQRQKTLRESLLAEQSNRRRALARLEQQIKTDAARIEQLQISERALEQALARVADIRTPQDLNLDGLAPYKGRLLSPTDGRVRQMYGRLRQGQVRWKGVLINADAGSPVRAVHDGKVLFSDWLRGFGLLTVIDHGEGYMSLYGHNQALLKQAGDVVNAGDSIALVGQSGGQSYPNLYFEIRHKGKPLNPRGWLN